MTNGIPIIYWCTNT